MNKNPVWITEQDVVELIGLPEAISAIEYSMLAEFCGRAGNMNKTMLQFDGKSNLHALGGQLDAMVGTKTWVHTKGGTCPLLLLWSTHDGQLVAVIEAFALGNLRTGGTSGVATKWLAKPDSSVMGIVGTGKQAMPQVAAVAAVRPIKEVRVFARTPENRRAFAERIEEQLGIQALAASSVHEATEDADVVTLITRATEPFLFGKDVKDGCHVNAIGAIASDREEFAQDLFDRAGEIVVDSLDSVKRLSREFMRQFQERSWGEVRPLGRIIDAGRVTWDPDRISLFKAMGMGLSDVAIGAAVVASAASAGRGRILDIPQKAPIRLNRQPA